ncbi:MAG: hypothetical protein WA104_04485 [Thermodesulfovibrionales bacterium]
MVNEKELSVSEDYIVPGIFDRKVFTTVASSVSDAAYRTGVARKER